MPTATTHASLLGPGLLTFGTAGSTVEFGIQLTKCTLEPADGRVALLSGATIADGNFKLTGEIYQDYTALTSLVPWCKAHAGEAMPFTFTPTTAEKLTATGTVEIAEVKFGGEVKKRNTTEFSFEGVGDYTFTLPA